MKLRAFGIALIVVIALVSVSYFAVTGAFGSAVSSTTEPPVSVQVTGSQIYVPVGETVYVYVKVYSASGASGLLTVQVKKDLIYSGDADYVKLSANVDLNPGDTKEVYLGGFPATDATCYGTIGGWCFPGSFREYFIKVYWDGQVIYDPTSIDGREFIRTYT